MLTAAPATGAAQDAHALADAVPGYICTDRDARGPVLVFTGGVTKDIVTRFRLLERPTQRPGRVDPRTATFLSAAALSPLRQLATKQSRVASRLTIVITDSPVRHQLRATGVAAAATIVREA